MHHPTTAAPLATSETTWSKSQQRFLAVLQQEEYRTKSVTEICRLAGYSSRAPWYQALEDERFTPVVQALGVATKRHHLASHLEVELATNIEEELAKDVWDIRRLKHDYAKHVPPTTYEVDFSWIINHVLREQVKRYFRLRLTRWRAGTCVTRTISWLMATFGESACLPMRKREEERKKALEEILCEIWAILNKRNILVSYSSKKEFTL